MRYQWLLGGAAGALLLVAAARPARAAPEDFQACDGYGASNANGDGMTRTASRLLGLIPPSRRSGNMRRLETAEGERGVAACDAALNDSRLAPAYSLRRASLLRARGVHQLTRDNFIAALADFERADQAGAAVDDPYYRRSFAVGTRLLRAHARGLTGARTEALEDLRAVSAARPYDPELGFAVARIELAATQDWDAYAERLRALAALNPTHVQTLYMIALMRGRFADLIALHPQLRFDLPTAAAGFTIVNLDRAIERNAYLQAEFDGAYAYALAAAGQAEQARAALAPPNSKLGEAAANGPAPRPDTPEGARASWRHFVTLRLQVAEGQVEAALTALLQSRPGLQPALLELVEAIRRALPADPRLSEEAVAEIRSAIERERTAVTRFELNEVVEALPEPESESRLPGYSRGSDGGILPRISGYTTRDGPVPGSQTIKFVSRSATIASLREVALLRAAEIARSQGRRGLLLVGRRSATRSMETAIYGDISQGSQSEVDVLYVDPAALPPGYQNAGWRVLDADAVWETLSPVYIRQPSRRAR